MAESLDLEAGSTPNNSAHGESLDNGIPSRNISDNRANFIRTIEGNEETSSYSSSVRGLMQRLTARFRNNETEPEYHSPNYINRSMEDYPNGYPRLGAFITVNKNNLIFRRFNYLQARVLLNLQDQLRAYEDELDELDRSLDRPGTTQHSSQVSDEASRIRMGLLQKIEDKFKTYISLLKHASYFSLRAEPLDPHFKSLKHFYEIYNPLPEKEKYYLHKEDLMAIKPREDTSGFDTRLTKFLQDTPNRWTRRIFSDSRYSGRHAHTIALSTHKIMVARGILLGFPLIVLLVGPIYPLYNLSQGDMTESTLVGIMFIQLGFTSVFACCLKYLTRPRRHELFACTVAYMGVLLVFMSQTIQKSK